MAAPAPGSSERVFGKQRAQLSLRSRLQSGGGVRPVDRGGTLTSLSGAPLLPPNAVGSRGWNWHPTSSIRARPPASSGLRAAHFATSFGGRAASLRVSTRPQQGQVPPPKNPRDLRSRRARTPRSLHCPPDRTSGSVRLRKPCALRDRTDWRRCSIPDSRASWLPKASWRSD